MSSNQPEKNLKSPEFSSPQGDSPINENGSENGSVYELMEECDGSSSEGENKDELETSPETKVSSEQCLEIALTYPLFGNLNITTKNEEGNLHLIRNDTFPEANENIDSQGFPLDDVIMCDELTPLEWTLGLNQTSPETKVSSKKCLEIALTYPLFGNLNITTKNEEGNLHLIRNDTFPEANENIDSQGFPLDDVIMCDELIQKVDEYLHGDIENVFQDESFKGVGAIEEVESENVEEGNDVVENAGVGLCEENKSSTKGVVESVKNEGTESENIFQIIHESKMVSENESVVKSKLDSNEDEANNEEEISTCDILGKSITHEDDSNVHGTDNRSESYLNAILADPSCVETSDVTSLESKEVPSIKSTEDQCGKSKADDNLESKDDIIVDYKDDANLESKEDISIKSIDDDKVEAKDNDNLQSKDDAIVESKDANLESKEDVSIECKDGAKFESKDDISIKSKEDAIVELKDANLESKEDISIDCKDGAKFESKDDISIKSKEDAIVESKDANLESKEDVSIDCKDGAKFESKDDISIKSKEDAIVESKDPNLESKEDVSIECKDDAKVESKDDANLESKEDVSTKSKDDIKVEYKDNANLESKDDVSIESKEDAIVESKDGNLEFKEDISIECKDDAKVESKDDANLESKEDVSTKSKDDIKVEYKDNANLESKDDVSIESKDNAIIESKDDSGEVSQDKACIKPTDDVNVQPTNNVSIQPTDYVSVKATADVSAQPTTDVSTQPINEVSVQPTPKVSIKPSTNIDVGETGMNTEDEDSDDDGDVHMESTSDTDDSADTIPLEGQHNAGKKDEPWYQPFSFANIPSMFDTDDAKTIKAHWDLFCSNSSKSCKENFLKECVSLSKKKYFVEICLNLSRDARIVKDLDLILNIVHTDWAASSDTVELRRSALVIQAIFSNKSCKLNSEQRKKLVQYLILLFTKKMDRKTFRTLKLSIPYLLAEVVKKRHKNNEISNECFRYLVNVLEGIFCQEVPVDSRILCGLLDTLVRIPITAVSQILPKCFDSLCKVADNARDILRKKKKMPVEFPEFSANTEEFDNKMDGLISAVEMYWKMCDACEVLMSDFFQDNFTPDGVVDHVERVQSYTFWRPRAPHESLAPFYRKCLDYFGEAITNRLSANYSQDKIALFLDYLDYYCSVRVLDNKFVDRNKHVFADMEEKRAKRIKLMYGPPTTVKFERRLPEKFKRLERRCGLIDVSRADEPKNAVPKCLKDAQTLKPPDRMDPELLKKLSKAYAEGCSQLLKRTVGVKKIVPKVKQLDCRI